MRITIEGARWSPSWVALQKLIQTMLEDPNYEAGSGKLTKIFRPDGHAGYRDHGLYELTFEYTRYSTPEVEQITLEVK